jgi:hypothetical protein
LDFQQTFIFNSPYFNPQLKSAIGNFKESASLEEYDNYFYHALGKSTKHIISLSI